MSGGLSNADFRALLATPRPGGGGGGRGGGDGQKQKPKKPSGGGGGAGKPAYRGGKPVPKDEAKDEGPSYRDRAEERRKGLSADFEGVPDDLVGLLHGQTGLAAVSYEDSKYLGGDVAHTHLVKGLDFALLQKVRAEQQGKRGQGEGGQEDEGAPALAKKLQLPGQPPQAPATFHTPLGREVYAFFFDPAARGPAVSVAEMFLPRRTAFVYELDPEEGAAAPDIPTTLRRSREDCPKVPERALGGVDAGVLGRIAKIMSYMTVQGGGKRKLKKKERQALLVQHGLAVQGAPKAAEPAGGGGDAAADAAEDVAARPQEGPSRRPPADDDEDIFGDAGTDYEPTIKDKQRAAAAAAAAAEQAGEAAPRRGGYFGGAAADLHADLPPLPREDAELGDMQGPAAGPARPPAGFDAAAAYGAYPEADAVGDADAEQAAAAAVREEKERQRKRAAELLSGGDDAYAECYPSYYDGATVVDSDDEGPPPGKEGALTRRDFANEADWEEYQREGMPPRKAEGRAKVRAQQRVASKEKNKISSNLAKIQKIFDDKGYDHTAAFAKAPRGGREGGEGEGAGLAEGGGGGAAFKKKRRI